MKSFLFNATFFTIFIFRAQYRRTAFSWTKGSNRRNGASSMNRYRQGITIFGHCKVLAVLFADNFNCRGYLRRVYVLAGSKDWSWPANRVKAWDFLPDLWLGVSVPYIYIYIEYIYIYIHCLHRVVLGWDWYFVLFYSQTWVKSSLQYSAFE